MSPRLVLVCGAPGSGKSTFVQMIFLHERIFEFDSFFPQWSHSKVSSSLWETFTSSTSYKEAHTLLAEKVQKALENGHSVVVVDIFNLNSMRKVYRDFCFQNAIPYCCIFIQHSSLSTLITRRAHLMDVEKLEKLVTEFEIPTCHPLLTISNDDSVFWWERKEAILDSVNELQEAFLQNVFQQRQEHLLVEMQKLALKQNVAHLTNVEACKFVHFALENYTLEKIEFNFPFAKCFFHQGITRGEFASVLRKAKKKYLQFFSSEPFNAVAFESLLQSKW